VFNLARVWLVVVAGALASGCTTSGMPTLDIGALNMGAAGADASSVAAPGTVAFELIDVPREPHGRKFAAQLAQEADARRILCVSQERPSQYRIEVYMAAIVQGQKTTITWIWDVSAANHKRVARFTGEVPGAPSERAWGAADDAVLARIARDGMSRLAAFLNSAPRDASSPDVASASGAQAPLAFMPSSRP
jgi:hypothetical protein